MDEEGDEIRDKDDQPEGHHHGDIFFAVWADDADCESFDENVELFEQFGGGFAEELGVEAFFR